MRPAVAIIFPSGSSRHCAALECGERVVIQIGAVQLDTSELGNGFEKDSLVTMFCL